ncbi:hypothetical protein BU24DRAFT_189539 [Aaosphaeria arxii CBS 175.79]|uniref:Uncharacterized protein n=1 Tax=Aaosphaeria arxii CBS 175.79 TaxID=1450172 RepID=A0A6A5XSU0_9PLEO|nr:uncharacterized protein BU24DRAFT_189539 [Aaosphaeria arxii CBS 175.79]KAF2015986.1 hypothetical protein BU24DRAFT_189539 [Aaosphaeria arxii CBS 175.79]
MDLWLAVDPNITAPLPGCSPGCLVTISHPHPRLLPLCTTLSSFLISLAWRFQEFSVFPPIFPGSLLTIFVHTTNPSVETSVPSSPLRRTANWEEMLMFGPFSFLMIRGALLWAGSCYFGFFLGLAGYSFIFSTGTLEVDVAAEIKEERERRGIE